MRHIPLLAATENALFKFNTHLKHHLRGLMNFVSIRALDFDELQEQNITTWFSSHEWYGSKTYDKFKEAYTKRKNDDTLSFFDLLSIKVVVKTNCLTNRTHDWLLRGTYNNATTHQHNNLLFHTTLKTMLQLHRCRGYQVKNSYKHFHSRKISLNKCKQSIRTVNHILDIML